MTEETFEKTMQTLLEKGGFPFSLDKPMYDKETNIMWLSLRSTSRDFGARYIDEIATAFNHLIRKMVEGGAQGTTLLPSLVVDIDGTEKKKIENLRALAHMMAERSKFFKSAIELDPMPARSRKIIHEYLAGRPHVRTSSTGEGPSRHVVIEFFETEENM